MRAALCVALCVVLIASAYAEDLELGKCNDDDHVIADRRVHRPAIPGVRMYAKLVARASSKSRIVGISVKTTDGIEPDVNVIKGGIGHRFVLILARGKPGKGLNLQFAACSRPRVPPTATPTPTPESTTSSVPSIPTAVPTTTEKVPSTTQTPESSSLPPTAAPTTQGPPASSSAPSMPPTSAAPEPVPTSIPTGVPTLPPRDDDDDDADLSELLSLDSLGED